MANPAVRAEIKKVMNFWLALGVAGFRMDAAPFVIEVGNGGYGCHAPPTGVRIGSESQPYPD